MTVKHSLRWIASLSAFGVAAVIATVTHAGNIPCGSCGSGYSPVSYSGYGYAPSAYSVSYARPVSLSSTAMYAPRSYYSTGCSSCSTGCYAPVSYAPSYGCGCGPAVATSACGSCGVSSIPTDSCLSGCSSSPAPATQPPNGTKSTWNSRKEAEPPKEPPPAPRTFQEPNRGAAPAGATDDGFGTSIRPRNNRAAQATSDDVEAPRPVDEEPTILNRKKAPSKTTEDIFDSQPTKSPSKSVDDLFESPVENNKPASNTQEGETSAIRLPFPTINLDAKIAWRADPQRTRVPLHGKIAKASVSRWAPTVDSDWTPVVTKSNGTQVAKK